MYIHHFIKTWRGHNFSPGAWIATKLWMSQDKLIPQTSFDFHANPIDRARAITTQSSIYSTFVPDCGAGLGTCAGIPLRTYHTVACSTRYLGPAVNRQPGGRRERLTELTTTNVFKQPNNDGVTMQKTTTTTRTTKDQRPKIKKQRPNIKHRTPNTEHNTNSKRQTAQHNNQQQ